MRYNKPALAKRIKTDQDNIYDWRLLVDLIPCAETFVLAYGDNFNFKEIYMYIHGTLSQGEKIEMVLNMHWAIYLFPMLLLALGIFLGVSNISTLGMITIGISLIYGLCVLIVSSTTEQVLTSRRVFGKVGVISRTTDELKNKQLETISISQPFSGMLFGYGDIKYTGTGGAFVLHRFVPNPQKVKRDFEALLYPDENAPSPATGKSEIFDDGKL